MEIFGVESLTRQMQEFEASGFEICRIECTRNDAWGLYSFEYDQSKCDIFCFRVKKLLRPNIIIRCC